MVAKPLHTHSPNHVILEMLPDEPADFFEKAIREEVSAAKEAEFVLRIQLLGRVLWRVLVLATLIVIAFRI